MSDFISVKAIKMGAVAGLIIGTAGCAQMTRHSNTLVFGTTTTIGVKVGQDASQTPTIEIGYGRQEAAFVPVLANTGSATNGDLNPCPGTMVNGQGGAVKVDLTTCKFEATNNGTDKDSYSTLASFGADVGATAGKGEVTLAQYFATGIAAQALALSGGANVVQAGGDTTAKADAAGKAADAMSAQAQARIAAEKTNAVKYASTMDTGELAAKAMLGDSSAPVDATKRAALATKIGVPACNDTELAKLDQRSVKQFLAEMKTQKFQCLARLGTEVQK
ncbi:hypothetical protein [Kordiimonas sp.]|uniref:hypothetical protein n=1 Tax=Kordiimonas sp. TaxID=1970157 RepID=UPI003A8E7D42